MKRTEIVDEITHILDMEAEDLCYPFLAELILTTLENKGMQPPSREMDCGCCSIEGWEQEDE